MEEKKSSIKDRHQKEKEERGYFDQKW